MKLKFFCIILTVAFTSNSAWAAKSIKTKKLTSLELLKDAKEHCYSSPVKSKKEKPLRDEKTQSSNRLLLKN